MSTLSRKEQRAGRRKRIRRRVRGTAERPRACVMVSNKHLYVQFVDDDLGATLCAVTTVQKGAGVSKSVQKAKELGLRAAEEARKKGIGAIVFDRGGFRYHGRVKAIADAMRESGLQF